MENENDHKKYIKNKKKRFRLSDLQKKIVFVLIGVLLLAGVAYGGWQYLEDAKFKKENTELSEKQVIFNDAVKKVADEALVFEAEGRPDKVIEVYEKAIEDTDDPELIYVFELQKAITILNVGHKELALNLLIELEKKHQNEDISQFIASIYLELEDYENAIKYYEKAISLVDKTHIDNTDYYQEKIDSIKVLKVDE